jgi:capsular polysaccharide biosynthesis protein
MKNMNELHTEDKGFLSFDPVVIIRDVLKRWLVIILVALAVGVGSYIYTDASYEPVYQTDTIFVVTTRGSSTTVYNNLTSTSNLASLFTELLNSSIMRKTIVEEMGVSSFNGTISTSVITNTNLITMTVTAPDPRMAFQVAQTLIERHETLTYEVVDGIVLEVLQNPTVPQSPANYNDASGRMGKMMVLAAIAAMAIMAVLSYMRNSVRSSAEARAKLDCDYLGEIPHENKYKTVFSWLNRKKTSILISNPVTSFHFVENIRKLRRRVEQRMDGGKVLMVTSLLENEGKSTVSVNLALAMAQKHKRVLLIDCDLLKPACHVILEQREIASGIKEVLQDGAKLNDSILKYKATNMYMLLAGKRNWNIGDLLTGDRMKELLDWARENFDFVILDLPPMSA